MIKNFFKVTRSLEQYIGEFKTEEAAREITEFESSIVVLMTC